MALETRSSTFFYSLLYQNVNCLYSPNMEREREREKAQPQFFLGGFILFFWLCVPSAQKRRWWFPIITFFVLRFSRFLFNTSPKLGGVSGKRKRKKWQQNYHNLCDGQWRNTIEGSFSPPHSIFFWVVV